MNLKVPLNFDRKEAKIALDVLEILIDTLIELYAALPREYEPWTLDPDSEFGSDDETD